MRNQGESGVEAHSIHLLVFNIMGIRLGADMEQIHGMKNPEYGGEGKLNIADFPYFHEMVPFHQESVHYQSPRVLFLRSGKEGPVGVIVDQPEDTLSLSMDSIRPLPPLLEIGRVSDVVWAAALRGEEIILLVDFFRLK